MSNWEDFWAKEPKAFKRVMFEATKYFYEQFIKKHPLTDNTVLLDFGCGPGYLIEQVDTSKAKVVGVDLSENYIDICKSKFDKDGNVALYQINSYDNESLSSVLEEQKVNTIVVLSVIQYYKNREEVTKFLNTIHIFATENQPVKIYLADVLGSKHSFIKDAVDIFINSIKRGYIIDFLKFMYINATSSYKKNKQNLLKLDFEYFEEFAKERGVAVECIEGLSLHRSRYLVLMSL